MPLHSALHFKRSLWTNVYADEMQTYYTLGASTVEAGTLTMLLLTSFARAGARTRDGFAVNASLFFNVQNTGKAKEMAGQGEVPGIWIVGKILAQHLPRTLRGVDDYDTSTSFSEERLTDA